MDPAVSELASTLQTASLNRAPSPHHDLNPSTAASRREPVHVLQHIPRRQAHGLSPPDSPSAIPVSVRPRPRRAPLPPLPDLRFEQSYLASLPAGASSTRIAWITTRDQVLMPLVQGLVWSLALAWWRHWNRGAQMAGQGVGARIRRWWWRVNNWKLPPQADLADKVKEFHIAQAGAGGD